MFQQIYHHPLLLLNGVLNIAYYTGNSSIFLSISIYIYIEIFPYLHPSLHSIIKVRYRGPCYIFLHIFSFLLHQFLNILGETMLYREPLGLIFLVLASLSSTFLINPLNLLFGKKMDLLLLFSISILILDCCIL